MYVCRQLALDISLFFICTCRLNAGDQNHMRHQSRAVLRFLLYRVQKEQKQHIVNFPDLLVKTLGKLVLLPLVAFVFTQN